MNARKFFSRVGTSYFVLIVLMVAAVTATDLIVATLAPRALARFPALYWVINFLPQYLLAMPVCFLILRRLPAMQIRPNRLGTAGWMRMLCISLFILEAGAILGNLFCRLLGRITPLPMGSGVTDLMSTGNLWVVFLFSVVLAPILEELLFRKALIDRTIVFGDRTAILLSGLLFGLVHGNFYQFFYAFGLGCLFAYLYIRTGKIRHTITFHMIANFLGGFVGTALERVVENSAASNSYYGFLTALLSHFGVLLVLALLELAALVLAVVGLVLFILRFRRRILLPGEYTMPAGQTGKALFGNVGMILFLAASAYLFVTAMIY